MKRSAIFNSSLTKLRTMAFDDALKKLAGRFPGRGIIDMGDNGSLGVRAPAGAGVTLQEKCPYYLGASSSPKFVILADVTDDNVSYFAYPFKTKFRMERWIAADLIAKGTKKALETYGSHMEPDLRSSMESCLRGGKGKPVDVDDYRPVVVEVTPSDRYKGQDLWREAEEYGNVGGRDDDDEGYIYQISSDNKRVEQLKNDNRFKVLKVTKEASEKRPLTSLLKRP